METNIKLSLGEFDPTTGISMTKIETKIGTFVGTAYLQDKDKNNSSRFFGCQLAEYKAIRNYYIALIKRLKLEARGMKQICDAIDSSIKVTDKNDLRPAAKIAKRNYNKKLCEITKLENYIKSISNIMSTLIEARDENIYGAK